MKRGSFQYRQKRRKYVSLPLAEREESENELRLRYGTANTGTSVQIRIRRENDLTVLTTELQPGQDWNRFRLTFPSAPNEHFYGCGEIYTALDLKGERVRIWVAEHQNASRIGRKLIRETLLGKHPDRVRPLREYESYYAQPTFVSSRKYFMHAETSAFAEYDFRKADTYSLEFQEPPTLYFGKYGSFEEVSRRLSGLLGRQRMLPSWVYDGAILAIQGGTETVEKKLGAALAAGAEICGVWSQDWCGCRRTGFGYQVMWNWEWDRELYPGLDEKIREWRQQGVRFLGYINPFLALEKELYKTASERGYCVKNARGEDYLVTITTFPAAMVDLTNPEAFVWYKDIIKNNMIGLGMGGWMADFGEYLPVDAVLFSGEDPAMIHNHWPAMWARLNREAIEECGAGEEVFFFTRAGYTGTVRESPMMWTGDHHVDWSRDDGLPSVIPATLSLAMSGFCLTHSDAGGYTTVMKMRRTGELLLRWEEMNAFSPLFRFHEGNQPVNNAQFDGSDELMEQLVRCSRRHKRLGSYLRSLNEDAASDGVPVMRPLFYHYDEEPAYTCQTEYLLGRDILVAPILKEGDSSRTVYLPEDDWVHLFSGVGYDGGEHTVDAPIGRPPVFIRKNSPWFAELIDLKN